ncbi:sensor histidine kinase [Nitrosophilus labii]|uniref:sensor histidine kinase n=1 Tax=Nitrosophilus labii TaxID=2706014 RepID=UPI00165755F7|nr:HAMP domain-containing sensor histidine kinase [Nitrosophilus labii]
MLSMIYEPIITLIIALSFFILVGITIRYFIVLRALNRYKYAIENRNYLSYQSFPSELKSIIFMCNKKLFNLQLQNDGLKQFNLYLAHEIKRPLTRILMSIEHISNLELDRLHKELLQTIKIIDRLLYLSNYYNLNTINRICINEVIQDIIHSLQSDIKITFLQNGLIHIHGDKDLIKIALQNIIGNAIKYSTERKKILIVLHSHKKNFLIIKDWGAGIQKSNYKKIFQFSYQESSFSQGYGIGLALAKWILDYHGLTIKIYSKKGYGTRVKIMF